MVPTIGFIGSVKKEKKLWTYVLFPDVSKNIHPFVCFFLLGLTETGEQVAEVLGFYVESSIMGHGNSCYNGHCIGQWRGIFYT